MARWFRTKLIDPIVNLLKQGITPDKIALSVALGCVLGVFPMLGTTTLLCGLAAWSLRLNLPAIQLVNYFIYPMQLVLLVPFLKAGSWLTGGAAVDLTIVQVFSLLKSDLWGTIQTFWSATVGAVALWFLLAIPVAALLYWTLALVLRRTLAQIAHVRNTA